MADDLGNPRINVLSHKMPVSTSWSGACSETKCRQLQRSFSSCSVDAKAAGFDPG